MDQFPEVKPRGLACDVALSRVRNMTQRLLAQEAAAAQPAIHPLRQSVAA